MVFDIWISEKKYSYHWQRTDGRIYRHDNAPHNKHKKIRTYPKHFHNGSENIVTESKISDTPEIAIKEFLEFIRKTINN